MNMLNAGSSWTHQQVHDLSGNVYRNHGSIAGSRRRPVERGDFLLWFSEDGYSYIAEIAQVDGSKVRFTGEDQWRDTTAMDLVNLLEKQGARR